MKKTAIVLILLLSLVLCGCSEKRTADPAVEFSFDDVSVHDPAVIRGEDGSYYIFGSHLAAARTDDLMN